METLWWLGFEKPKVEAVVLDPPGRTLEGTHSILADRIRRVHTRHPCRINSARRYYDDQKHFWDCAEFRRKNGYCPSWCNRSMCASANYPGQSNHEFGLAVDMEPLDDNWMHFVQVCRQEQLHAPILGEPWHWQPTEIKSGSYQGMPEGWN